METDETPARVETVAAALPSGSRKPAADESREKRKVIMARLNAMFMLNLSLTCVLERTQAVARHV
eukprot:6186914-Pleurochrysis_carterae.AAC.2